jgi:hypothetical protein
LKFKVTKKEIKNNYDVYATGYCGLQWLLRRTEPIAYSVSSCGWACDYYDVGGGICISTGYSPVGKKIPSKLSSKYDNIASHTESKEELDVLLDKFVKELISMEE